MELIADRKRLQDAIQVVGGVAMLRTLKDVLQNVHFEARDGCLTLKATDYEVGIQVRIPDVNIQKEGAVLLPSARAVGIVREVSEPEVSLKVEGAQCLISAGRSRFKVVRYDPEQFPGLPAFPLPVAARLPRDDLVKMIRRVLFSSAEERTRYAFDGIKLQIEKDRMRMVSTDGKRLGYCWVPREAGEGGEVDALLPARAMSHFVKALGGDGEPCEIGIEGNRFGIRSNNVEVHCQQIEGSFPNFGPLLEKDLPHQVELDSEELLSALRRASLFAGSDARVVRLKLGVGSLEVNSVEAEVGEAVTNLPIEYAGEPAELGFNPEYLMDFLKNVGPGSVRMEFQDDETASRWSSGENFLYLVMPVST